MIEAKVEKPARKVMPKIVYPVSALLLIAAALGGFLVFSGSTKGSPLPPVSLIPTPASTTSPSTAPSALPSSTPIPSQVQSLSTAKPTQSPDLSTLAVSQVKTFLLRCLQSHSLAPTDCGFNEKHDVTSANWSLNGNYFLNCDKSSPCTKVLHQSGETIVKMRFITVDRQGSAPQGRYTQVWNLTCTIQNLQNSQNQKISCR